MGLSKGMAGFEDMGDTVGLYFGMMNLMAMLFAFALPKIAELTSRKATHMVCMTAGALGLISIMFIHDEALLYISFALIEMMPSCTAVLNWVNEKRGNDNKMNRKSARIVSPTFLFSVLWMHFPVIFHPKLHSGPHVRLCHSRA